MNENVKEKLYSQTSEQYIIKVLLNRPKSVIEAATKLKGEDFYIVAFRHLFHAIRNLADSGDVTPEGIMTFLEHQNKEGYEAIQKINGIAAINFLIDDTLPDSPSIETQIETLKSFTYRRKAIDVANKIFNYAVTNVDDDHKKQFKDVSDIDTKVKELTYGLASSLSMQKEIKNIGSNLDKIKEMIGNKGINGIDISQKFPRLNMLIKGLRRKALYVIGAPEKTGKSTVLTDIAYHVARDLGIPVGYGDTEMTEEEVLLRMISKESGISEDDIIADELTHEQRIAVNHAYEVISKIPFYHFNCNTMTNNELESEVKLLQIKYGIELFIYDYVKIQSHEAEKGRLDMIMAAKIDTLKEKIAKQCDIPVLTSGQTWIDDEGFCKFAETSHFTKLADVIAFLKQNNPKYRNAHEHLGSHYIEIAMGRKINRDDVGKTVDLQFLDNHRIREI